MCDYSLQGVKNRLAVEGESLTVHKWPGLSKGLASPADIEAARPRWLMRLVYSFVPLDEVREARRNVPAVCVPPGAKLRLTGMPKYVQDIYGVGDSEDVTFTQLSSEPFRYRDAFRFANGKEALIQRFPEGVGVEVLALSAEEETEVEETSELIAVPVARDEWRLANVR